jgi:hypothetical protein
MRTAKPIKERFEAKYKVDDITECWLWIGYRNKFGYGILGIKKNGESYPELAHRVSYKLSNGNIPRGKCVLHSCHNGKLGCVNPAHLHLGTRRQNITEMVEARRQAVGEINAAHKLTTEQVTEIRDRSLNPGSNRVVGLRYGVSRTTISDIRAGHYWKHLLIGSVRQKI